MPSISTYESLAELLPSDKLPNLRKEARDRALSDSNAINGAALLLELGFIDIANKHLLENREQLSGVFYGTLLGMAERFEAHGKLSIQVLIYRELLLDILERGYSKAYKHSADYYWKLDSLHHQIRCYPDDFESREAFEKCLREKHGRKRSFWDRVENY
jgi:hypothetical protein